MLLTSRVRTSLDVLQVDEYVSNCMFTAMPQMSVSQNDGYAPAGSSYSVGGNDVTGHSNKVPPF